MLLAITALAAMLASATSGPVADWSVNAPSSTPGWVRMGPAPVDAPVTIKISVKKQHLEALALFVDQVSDPASDRYGQYMTAVEVNDFTKPLAADVDAVAAWVARSASLSHACHTQGIVHAEFTAAAAAALFSTEFYVVREASSGKERIRAADFTLPAAVAASVSAVFGMHGLPLPAPIASKEKANAPSVPVAITPKVLATTYGTGGAKVVGGTKNRMAVAEFQGQFMNTSDLKAFFNLYLPESPASDAEVYAFHGKEVNGEGVEAQLDIQFMMGVAPGIKAEFYEQAANDFGSDLKNWTASLLAVEDSPWVHSVSYGWQGNLTQIGVTPAQQTDVDADFMKLSARGISVIFASGDSGSGYTPPQPPQPAQCSRTDPGIAGKAYTGKIIRSLQIGIPPDDKEIGPWICCQVAGEIGQQEHYKGWTLQPNPCSGKGACTGNCTIWKTITGTQDGKNSTSGKAAPLPPKPPHPPVARLWPSWPASSPYVTSVGATRFIGDVVGAEEAAVSTEDHFGSGGGFSPWTFFPQPKWQAEAVATYLSTVDPSTLPGPGAVWDRTGRATPDVGVLGTGYAVVNNGKPIPGGVGGTSASTPAFAGMVALINDARIAAGKPTLGLLNPFIYSNTDAFTDVTVGSDKIARGGMPVNYGFNCSKGWDPVTGVGTPIFAKMLAAAMQL